MVELSPKGEWLYHIIIIIIITRNANFWAKVGFYWHIPNGTRPALAGIVIWLYVVGTENKQEIEYITLRFIEKCVLVLVEECSHQKTSISFFSNSILTSKTFPFLFFRSQICTECHSIDERRMLVQFDRINR